MQRGGEGGEGSVLGRETCAERARLGKVARGSAAISNPAELFLRLAPLAQVSQASRQLAGRLSFGTYI